MATPRFAWGIDVGNRALKAVKLIPGGPHGLSVDEFEIIEHETVLSAAGDNRDALVTSALANFVARHPGIEKGQVGIGVSGQQSFARFIKLPPVEDKRIPEIVRFEAIQQIPFPLDDVEWSYQLFREADSPEVEVGIFAMRKELINAHIKNFTDIDLNVQVVQMNPLAVYNAMYYDSRIKGATMIVDLGAENTDLIIAEGESVWLRSIPLGGNNFTEALTKAFKVNFTKAEDLKRNASTSKYGRQIMQAMRPNFADLVSEIQRSMGFYASTHKDSRIAKVIALGSTFRLPGLQRYLQQNLQLDVEKIDGLSAGAPTDPKLAASFNENILSVATAYGLALQVMGQGKVSSSLLPEHIRREKMWREKTKWFGAAAALFVLGAAVPYGSYYYNNFQLQQQAGVEQQISSVQSQAKALDSKWSDIEQAGGADRQRIINMDSLVQYRGMESRMLVDFYQSLPQNQPGAQHALTGTNLDEIKSVPRGTRQQIFLNKIGSRFYPDLTPAMADPDFGHYADESIAATAAQFSFNNNGGGMPAMPAAMPAFNPGMGGPGMPPGGGSPPEMSAAPAAGGAAGLRGFLITMKVTTPNAEGYDFVERALVQKLLMLKPGNIPADQPYYIGRGVIARKIRVGDDTQLMQKMVADYNQQQSAKAAAAQAAASASNNSGGPPPGMPPIMNMGGQPQGMGAPGEGGPDMPMGFPGPAGMGAAGNTAPPEAYQDPILHEDVRDDTECTIVFAVLLDPPPAPAKTVASAAGAQ